MTSRRAAALAAALSSALALACAKEPPPDAAYRALVEAVRARDGDRAWALLSPATQAWLDARAKAAAERAPGVVPPSGRELLVGGASVVRMPKGIVVLRESADRAVLQVEEEVGGPAREVTLVKDGGWRVEIPAP